MSEHAWKDYRGTPACSLCGVVRRADGRNKPCSGKTPFVTTRITATATDADAYCLDVFAPDVIPDAAPALSAEDIEALRYLKCFAEVAHETAAIRHGMGREHVAMTERALAVLDRLIGAKP